MSFDVTITSLTSSIEYYNNPSLGIANYNWSMKDLTRADVNLQSSTFNTLLKVDQIVAAARFSTLFSIGRIEENTTNLQPIVIDNRETDVTHVDAILAGALYTIPYPVPGSDGSTVPTDYSSLGERGALACYSRGENVDVYFTIQRCTLDGSGGLTLIGDPSVATASHGPSLNWEGGVVNADPGSAPAQAPFLYFPTGSQPGDLYRLQVTAKSSSRGLLDGVLVFEPPMSALKMPL